jgi:hypothetical protein
MDLSKIAFFTRGSCRREHSIVRRLFSFATRIFRFSKNFFLVPRERFLPPRSRASLDPPDIASGEWRRPGSNRQPPACKAGALPVELRPRAATEISDLKVGISDSLLGPGRFGLPTSRLSGVRSNQLSYEPWKNPTSALSSKAGQPPLVRTSVYNDSVSKEQQKNRCFFTASGSKTFLQVFPAVKA